MLLIFACSGQEIKLEFEFGKREYKALKKAEILSNKGQWSDDFWEEIELGFEFKFLGEVYEKATVRSGGLDFQNGKGRLTRRIFALYRLLQSSAIDGKNSEISYHIEFDNQFNESICKIQWKNAGLIENANRYTQASDYVNIQIWLHEKSGKITYHFGESQLSKGCYLQNLYEAGPMGIKLLIDGQMHSPTGPGDEPTYVVVESSVSKFPNITSFPSNGTYYCFQPK